MKKKLLIAAIIAAASVLAIALSMLIVHMIDAVKAPTVLISELMLQNRSYPNTDREFAPWIELHNPEDEAVDISGWTLSCGEERYSFPQGSTIAAQEYTLLFCANGYLPLDIADASELCLTDPEGELISSVTLQPLADDESLVNLGNNTYKVSTKASPGYENTNAGHDAYLAWRGSSTAPILISELMPANKSTILDADGDFSDWIEFENAGSESYQLKGYYLSDNENEPFKWAFPDISLSAGEKLLVFCSEKDRSGDELHTNFSIDSAGESLYFTSPTGLPLWNLTYSAVEDDHALCYDDGIETVSLEPSPGYENSTEGWEQFLASNDRHGALTINEAVLYNLDYAEQKHEFYDWVELKNSSDAPLLLSDYYLSDSLKEPMQFQLPEVTLQPGELYTVFCSGDLSLTTKDYTHAPFAISAEGESIYLFNADASLSDRLYIHDTPYGGSMGRLEGLAGFYYFADPSPENENTAGFRQIAAKPSTSLAQGVYEDIDTLQVELLGEGRIYYTLDGSLPDESDLLYSEPLTLSKTTVIRAVAFAEGKVRSDCSSFSYFLNEGHTVPVVSLVCEPTDMFNGQPGIYTNYWNDIDIDANVAYFGDDGEFSRDCSAKLHGASSRRVWAKKSFKLIFRSRFGGDLQFDLFQNGEESEYHSILLRGANVSSMHLVRDELASLVAKDVCDDAYALDSRYCALYINGEYWGAYAIREAYSEKYFADYSGASEESIVISRAPAKSGELLDLFNWIIKNDMSIPENYEYASSYLDMESLATWMTLESYFNNLDPAGNIRYFKGDYPDTKWRLAFFDLDIAMTSAYAGWEQMFFQGYQIGEVTRSLRKSPDFRQTLLEKASELYHNGLNTQNVHRIYDEICAELETEIRRNGQRWGESYELWEWNSADQRNKFCQFRTSWWIVGLGDYLDLSEETLTEYFGDYNNAG